ncbi:MAG: hypothetical protein C5S38_03900 [Candidatus Methanophagaceae archaeon]|nr:MAG: hypothetical protein C5S38_03900 [Methanophagales archaeon]KAF5431320.1 Branched-chain amino acid aminotransferase/4-amino-4-deoxychorismate lyase [Methanophagales archaeon]
MDSALIYINGEYCEKRGRTNSTSRIGCFERNYKTVHHCTIKKLNIVCSEKNMTLIDVYTSDDAFMTGTLAEIVPVVEVDGREIGDGKPGEITKRLMAEFVESREAYGIAAYNEKR